MKRYNHLDFETRSECDLRKYGAAIYAMHPSTAPLCLCFGVDDGPIKLVINFDHINQELETLAKDPDVIFVAHNAAFEMWIWSEIMVKKLGYSPVDVSRWKCAMAKCYAHGLPGSLEAAGEYLKLKIKKNKRGKELIDLFCIPKTKGGSDFRSPADYPLDFHEFCEYCRTDVGTERELDHTIGDLSPAEQEMWEIDSDMNRAGVRVDIPFIMRAMEHLEEHKKVVKREFARATKGAVESPTQRVKVLAWINERTNLQLDNTRKPTISETLTFDYVGEGEDELPDDVREALEMMGTGSKSSNAKYKSMWERSNGGIIRDTMQYHGAHTGRWAGRKPQMQNLPRRPGKFDMLQFIKDAMWMSYPALRVIYGDVAQAYSWALRGCILAGEGYLLRVGDLSQMEARMLAWLSGEEHILEAFRKYDAGTGPDIYCVTAEGIYGYPVTKDMEERQPGKVGDLAFGYGGGIGAYAVMAKAYGVDLMVVAPGIIQSATLEELRSAIWVYDNHYLKRAKDPVNRIIGVAVDIIKQRWRASHPKTVQFWKDLEACAIQAVKTRQPVQCGKLLWFMHKQFLVCLLPNGRTMKYPYPVVRETKEGKMSLSYLSARGWRSLYGGKVAENVTQAAQRDALVDKIKDLTKAGYRSVLHTHDEPITVSPIGHGSLDEFKSIMVKPLHWAPGLPIAASAEESTRYLKG